MELKKNESHDLENKRPLFFNIGLVVALSATIVAFNWKGERPKIDISVPDDEFEVLYDIPATKIPPPEAPKPLVERAKPANNDQAPIIIESNAINDLVNEVIIDQDFDDPIGDLVGDVGEIPEEVVDNVPFDIVEDMPAFPGGISAFYKYVGDNMSYPSMARRMAVDGKVYVQFIIDRDGSITDVKAVKGIGAGCDEEAVRVLENSPKWAPGKQRGRAVRVRMILPITFKLSN